MRIARAGTIGILGVIAMMLAGCGDDGRAKVWRKITDVRMFLAPMPCSGKTPFDEFQSTGKNANFYEMPSSRWWLIDDHCRNAQGFCAYGTAHPDRYAVAVTIVDEYGAMRVAKSWVVSSFDFWGGVASKYTVQTFNAQYGETCVVVVSIPWQGDRNRPFLVADETLRINPAPLAANKDRIGLVWFGLVGLITIGTFFVAAAPEARGRRGLEIFASLFVAAVGFFFLYFVQDPWIVGPYERLLGAQAYYRFFTNLPQVGGHLLPLSTANLLAIQQGPPLTTGSFTQEVEKFWVVAFCVLALWLVSYWQRLCVGFHYLFVQHPAEPFVLPALRNKTRIDVKGLAQVLNPKEWLFKRPPPADQSENQAERARALKKKLDAEAEIAEAALKRERVMAALLDAEREVTEAKRRAKKR